MNYINPIQMPNLCLRIVDSNGKPRDTTIYEIQKICEELNSGTLSYIDVYDKGSFVEGYGQPIEMHQRLSISAELIAMYGKRIANTFQYPLNVPCSDTEITPEHLPEKAVPAEIVQADIVYPKSQVVSNLKYTPQIIAANNLADKPTASVQAFTLNSQNIMANLVPAKPTASSQKESPPNAALEAKRFLNCVRIVSCSGGIYMYTGTYYKLLDKLNLQKMICKVLHEDIAEKGTFSYVEDIYRFVVTSAESLNFEKLTVENKIMFDGCVLNLDTLRTEPHNPHNCNVHALSVSYVPYDRPTPVFDKYIYDLSDGDEILICRLWEALGMLISNDVKAKRIVILFGKGNTGKSVFGHIVRELIADDAVTSFTPQKLTDRFVGTSLVNSAVNICMDLPSVPIDASTAAILKNLSGGDTVSGEVKYMNSFNYVYQGQLLFGTNYPLKLTYLDQAFADRLLIIPCENPIQKHLQNKNLLENIRPELPMIASRAVRAFSRVRKNNYIFSGDDIYSVNAEDIYTKSSVNVTVNNGIAYSVECFADQMCEVTSDNNDCIPIPELYAKYCVFCESKGLAAISNTNTFSKELHKALPGISNQKKRVNGPSVNIWYPLKIRTE